MSFTLTLYVYLLSWLPPCKTEFNLLKKLTKKNPIDDMTDHKGHPLFIANLSCSSLVLVKSILETLLFVCWLK